ncbi:5-amino-6-(5-phospho-D-ribitylamino)uracil phosphatase YigB [Candidatus Tachikawaea gelatinosa]|uniref:Uncharacterized HAD-hydrolase MTH_209 n=1 Tax=Candidatus Tachikawaea gelatinosa TaxID=1410383 RepID=A0A090APZ9_9ENTR|nr:5-amino-6-(5-phospho-D-ribitylamino)uracil phosphatase YigB [Candidatus Tachikawaea gelatinosa]BAP58382.1 uncharacterized HAD-hydrolase MTH_209 [Candidatus Tachikawaea gelatinosa]
MKFYRSIRPIYAITFDLDDTLYDNHSVICKTINESHIALQKYHPLLKNFTKKEYQKLRKNILKKEPEIYHNVTEWRLRSLELAMLNVGFLPHLAKNGAKKIMSVFSYWRNKIKISENVHITLSKLMNNFPLVAITNGNVQLKKIGIENYFKFILYAGLNGRSKPYEDMYKLASYRLKINIKNILHVGDDLIADIFGSIKSGMQSCWINNKKENLIKINSVRLLPHMEISKLDSLISLI